MLTSETFWTTAGVLVILLLVIAWVFLRPDSETQETEQERKIRAKECSEEDDVKRIIFEFWQARRDLRGMCEGDRELFEESWPRIREDLERKYPAAMMKEVRCRLVNFDREHFPPKLFPQTKEQGGLYV